MLDLLMFWKKKKEPGDSSAQYLVNVLGASEFDVASQTVVGETRNIDVHTELFERNNFAIAKLVVIAGLLKNDDQQRSIVLRSIEPEDLGKNSFDGYLFSQIRESLKVTGKVSPSQIGEQIYKYRPTVDGQASPDKSLEEHLFTWSLVLGFEITPSQVDKAIEIIKANIRE